MASKKRRGLKGNSDLDRVLAVLLGTSMFVGGVMACILDNTVPGTNEERGIDKWRSEVECVPETADGDVEQGDLPGPEAELNENTVNLANDTEFSHENVDVTKRVPHGDLANGTTILQGDVRSDNTDVQNDDGGSEKKEFKRSIYDLPLITPYLMKIPCARYWPFLPSFAYNTVSLKCKKCKKCSRDD